MCMYRCIKLYVWMCRCLKMVYYLFNKIYLDFLNDLLQYKKCQDKVDITIQYHMLY